MAMNSGPLTVLDGLILYLDAGNTKSYPGSGTTWSDLSGNGRDATLWGSIAYTSSQGGAFVFNGSNTYAVTNYNGNLTTDFTISSWFKASVLASSKMLISKNSYFALSAADFPFATQFSATTIFSDISAGDDYTADGRVSGSISTNTWYNVSTTYNQSVLRMYINGELISSTNATVALSSNTQYWTIGRAATENGGGVGATYFSGSVSNFSIYNRALTAQEVSQNFNALRGRYSI